MAKKAKKSKKSSEEIYRRGGYFPLDKQSTSELTSAIERLTGKTLDQLVKEAPKKELRFIGGSTFYGTKEDFDKWSKTGVRF
jgi:hypothetical protein